MPGKRVPFSDEEKMERKRRDSERKRRDQLTSIQLEHVRSTERKRMKKRRQFMSNAEKDKVKEQDRNRKSCRYRKACKLRNKKNLQEIRNIDKVLRMRNLRSLLSEEETTRLRTNAKVTMSSLRKNGFVKKYKQREKRDKNYLIIWKKFLNTINLDLFMMNNPRLKNLHIKLNKIEKEVKEMENKRREEAHLAAIMPTWKSMKRDGKNLKNLEEMVNKNMKKMRKHRKEIKLEIKDYEKSRRCSGLDKFDNEESDSDTDENDIY